MAETFKVLAQSKPSGGVLTDAYIAPLASTISSIVVANQSSALAAKFRVSVAIAGAADTPAQYTHYDVTLQPNKTATFTIGVTVAATDVIRVYSDTGNLSFNIFGVQIS